MNITIKNSTVKSEPLSFIGKIAGMCYGKEESGDPVVRAKTCFKHGHMSVFEHISITWRIEGISRACSHQLVRHRLASFTQESQRYVCETLPQDDSWYVTPPSMAGNDAFTTKMAEIAASYNSLVDEGIRAEDARYLLPNAAKTNITVSMNLREFFHFYETRTSRGAQWEIKDLAKAMLDAMLEEFGRDGEWSIVADLCEGKTE